MNDKYKILFLSLLTFLSLNAFTQEKEWLAKAHWEKKGFEDIEINETFYNTHATTSYPLAFLIQKESLFNEHLVLNQVEIINEIFEQCDVEFGPIYIITAKDKQNFFRLVRYDKRSPYSLSKFRSRVPIPQNIITINLVSKFIDAKETSGFSFANWTNGRDLHPKVFKTIWITDYIFSDEYKKLNNNRYNIFAHELMHVLTRRGQHIHPYYRSLMSISRTRTNTILPKTCDSIIR